MKAAWLKLAARYDAFSLRERRMVAAAVLGGILLVATSLFIDPALKRLKIAERGIAEQRTQLTTLQAQTRALQSPGQNPDVAVRAELVAAKKKLAELGGRFAALENALVSPQRMPGLLEDLIGRQGGLRLLSLRTLPVAPVLDKKVAANAVSVDSAGKAVDKLVASASTPDISPGLFKHGVEIKLEGSYQELAAYLARLEKSPAKLLWSGVALSAEKHPKLVLTLTVYTLSLDHTWLIV